MRTPGFSAEGSLSSGGDRIVPQLSRDKAEQVRNQMGFGSVLCYPHCLQWGSCGYDPNSGMCCNYWSQNCYWWPTSGAPD